MHADAHATGARSALAAAAATFALTALLLVSSAGAAQLKAPGSVHVTKAGVTSLSVAWKDRARGERSYKLTLTAKDGAVVRKSAGANVQRAKVGGLRRGGLYDVEVAACARTGCGKTGHGKRAATLLAPFNGAHPRLQCGVLPETDDFNAPVAAKPVAGNSDEIMDNLSGDLHPDFGSNLRYGIPYVVVPPFQPKARIKFTAYGSQSDKGPYPIPPGAPVEGGRRGDGDRHVLVVQRPARRGGGCNLFELYRSFQKGSRWEGESGSVFDLGRALLGQRPQGWTSADAAGLPIFPGLVTLEEVKSGEIDHAIRMTFDKTRRAYYPPATHYASDACRADLPAMGERLRLKAGYDISQMSGDARVIATALKEYGGIVADNGSNFYISGSTDRRWNDNNLNQLKEIPGDAFEVVRPERKLVSPC